MSGLSQYFINDLKQKVALSDFVKTVVTWDKKKSSPSRQDWWSPCPFHYEKSASFHVDDRKGFYHCFGCGVHGSVLDWLMEHQKMTFIEAVTHLCQVTNTAMPEFSKQNSLKTEKKKSLYDLMQHAQDFYIHLLFQPQNHHALDYVTQQRGINKENIEKFGIGYSSNHRTGLFDFLTNKGYSPQEMIESGLIIAPEDGGKPYDRFRNRIMFPVKNLQGHIITYGGRALDKDAHAKYLNGSETEIFKKSMVLYNLDKAIQKNSQLHSYKKTDLIVCEGYMDVITLGIYGFHNAVAPMGTALTNEQIKLLWRYCDEPILCFDGDKAGLNAACRAANNVLDIIIAGYSLKFCFLPNNLDPDDFLKKQGKEAFKKIIDNAVPLSAVLFAYMVQENPLTTPEKRAKLEKEFYNLCNKIPDNRLKELYLADLFSRLKQFTYQKPQSSFIRRNYFDKNNFKPSYAVESYKKNYKNQEIDSIDYMENMILGFFSRFGLYLKSSDFNILSQFSFCSKEKQDLQTEILNNFLTNHIKTLENCENMPSIPFGKIDLETGQSWQFAPHICQSDTYRQALLATESIKMTLNLPFINHNDFINYLSEILRYGLCDMYHKLLSKRESDRFLQKISSIEILEEKLLKRFLDIKKQSSSIEK